MEQSTEAIKKTPLQLAQDKMREMRASGTLVIQRLNPVERAKANPNSLKMAIKAHCWNCMGSGSDPNVQQSVRDCSVLSCALHPHRPWQKVAGKSADQMTEEEFAQQAGIAVTEETEEEDE